MSKPDMRGKVCMVTGATDGIGLATAQQLADMGASVIVVGRSAEKGEAVVSRIKARNGSQNVDFMRCDLSSQASIRQLGRDFKDRSQPLHVLINNAGVMNMQRLVTVDGFETTFAVNHLAYFLLTNLLLDVLKASAPARIVNVSSAVHTDGTIDFDNLQGEKRYSMMTAYPRSKLANALFTYALAKRLQGTGVTANALHPGVIRTGLGADTGPVFGTAMRLFRLFLKSAERGAETSVYLASSPEVEGVTGQYFDNKTAVKSSPSSYDEALGERLWQVSTQLTGLDA
jgi:NAD(P)-dependent dehydrogenase (short-subunit alcohol dehydrogenase family)